MSKPLAPEFHALVARDRIQLATEVFVIAFTPDLGASYPYLWGQQLGRVLAEVGSVPIGTWTWTTDRATDGALARLVLELVLIWERGGLAARGLFSEGREVGLLMRGEELLRRDDPRGAVEEALRASGDSVLS